MNANVTQKFPKIQGRLHKFAFKIKKVAENFLHENFTLNVNLSPSDRQIAEKLRQSTLIFKVIIALNQGLGRWHADSFANKFRAHYFKDSRVDEC